MANTLNDLTKGVQSGQTLSFLTGPQSAVDTILADGQGAIHGAFYLTNDTHRLYVGNSDTSLSPVNEGVTTITGYDDLVGITPTNSNDRKALTGRFYYLSSENILCVYNGSNWIRINNNTNNVINRFTYTVDTTNELISTTVGDDGNHTATDRFKVAAGDGVSVSYGSTNVTIDGNSVAVPTITVNADYSIGIVTEQSAVKVKLSSVSGTNNDSSFTVAADQWNATDSTNVAIGNDNGTLTIAAKDSKINTVAFSNNSTAGFDLTITDNYNQQKVGTISPQIQYGTTDGGNTPVTVNFENGKATLNVYSKGQIDDIMTALNAMHYIGTWGSVTNNPSGADSIDWQTTAGEIHAYLGGSEVPLHIGDTFLAIDSTRTIAIAPTQSGQPASTKTVTKGSLIIARSTDGTEQADGTIAPSKVAFDIVESTQNTDTQFKFVQDTDQQGIMLQSYNNGSPRNTGALLFTGKDLASDAAGTVTNDNLIKVTKSYTDMTDGGKQATILIQHKDVARTNTAGTKVTQNRAHHNNNFEAKTTVSVITAVTTNESGHVTGVTTTEMDLYDTASYFPATGGSVVTTTVYEDATDHKKVGVIQNTLTLKTQNNGQSQTTGYTAITSKSLAITDDDTHKIASGSSQAASGLNIEMVWGSFGS